MLRPNLNDATRAAPRVHRLPATLLALTLAAFNAAAADADIEVVTVKGDVRVFAAGQESPAKAGSTLELPSSVITGHDGSTDLRQGETRIGIGPNTRLDFPASDASDGAADRIVQPLGNAFYDVGARGSRRLRVETPYLVAVIKGTQFTVAVGPDSGTISLHEGSLEILAPGTDASVMLEAGEIAIRHRGDETIRVIPMREGGAPATGSNATKGSKRPDSPVVLSDSAPAKPVETFEGKLALDAGATLDSDALINTRTGVEADADLGAGTIDAAVDSGVDLGAGPLDAGVEAELDLGAGTAAGDVDLAVDTDAVDADLGVDASLDAEAGTVELGAEVLDTGIDVGLGGDSLIDVDVSPAPDADDSGGLLGGILRRVGL